MESEKRKQLPKTKQPVKALLSVDEEEKKNSSLYFSGNENIESENERQTKQKAIKTVMTYEVKI